MRRLVLLLLLGSLSAPAAWAQYVTGTGLALPGAPDDGPPAEVTLPRLHGPAERLAGRYVRVVNDLLVPDALRNGAGAYDLADPRVVTPHAGAPGDFRHAPESAASPRCDERRAFLAGDGRALDCSHFDDVHVYHHLDRYAADFWQDRLGWDPPFQAVVVTHDAGSGGLARWRDAALYLRDGGLYLRNVARERDLVLHEYVHLVTGRLGLAVDTLSAEETWALSEGYADYFAATYTGDATLGTWATDCPPRGECSGPADDPDLRTLASDPAVWNWRDGAPDPALRYGVCTRYHTGDGKCKTTWANHTPPYVWGMIWAGMLWDLRAAVGAEAADRLAFDGLRRVASADTRFAEAARGLTAAAEALDGGAHLPEVRRVLAARGFGAVIDVDREAAVPAPSITLTAYPNPADGPVTVAYRLDRPAPVVLDVFDVLGRRVARLSDGPRAAGAHEAAWAADVAPGVYAVRLFTPHGRRTTWVVR